MLKKLLVATATFSIFTFTLPVQAVTLQDIDSELTDISQKLAQIKDQQNQLKGDLDKFSKQLNVTVAQIDQIDGQIQKTKDDLNVIDQTLQDRQEKLSQQVQSRDMRVRVLYKRTYHTDYLDFVLGQNSFSQAAENLAYQVSSLSETKHIIESLNKEIAQYEQNKADLQLAKNDLEANLNRLASLRNNLAAKKSETTTKLSNTEKAIKSLTARQEELLALKTSSFTTSVGEVPLPDDFNSSIGYRPSFSPAFALFSYGAPHRVGMSQYGAYGRAKSGQSAETIVKAYFANVTLKKDYPVPANINVDGYGSISFEDNYMKGIGEVPSSWGDNGGYEALKAQAIVSRTYALAVIGNGGSICPTEACQVYLGYNKGGNWERAVNDTKGWVLTDSGGSPIKAWFSSTTGGFTHSSAAVFGGSTSYAQGIADTTCGSPACWTSQSYEVIASSPWFYKAWYKSRSGDSGGRISPWLTGEEFGDIINALMLYQTDPSLTSHLSQTDAANSSTWSPEQLKQELRNRGQTPANKVESVQPALYSNAGYTTSVNIVTDAGPKSYTGTDFRLIFNLRAPGRIWIPSLYSGSQPTGPAFFNIEQK